MWIEFHPRLVQVFHIRLKILARRCRWSKWAPATPSRTNILCFSAHRNKQGSESKNNFLFLFPWLVQWKKRLEVSTLFLRCFVKFWFFSGFEVVGSFSLLLYIYLCISNERFKWLGMDLRLRVLSLIFFTTILAPWMLQNSVKAPVLFAKWDSIVR